MLTNITTNALPPVKIEVWDDINHDSFSFNIPFSEMEMRNLYYSFIRKDSKNWDTIEEINSIYSEVESICGHRNDVEINVLFDSGFLEKMKNENLETIYCYDDDSEDFSY